jgi:hypothetical protein
MFGRVLKSLAGFFKDTPGRVSEPEEIHREAPVSEYGQPEVTYPRGWNQADIDFWRAQVPDDYRRYYTDEEWDEAQEALEQGWMHPSRSEDAVRPYREHFFEVSTMRADQFDWRAFREWYAAQ